MAGVFAKDSSCIASHNGEYRDLDDLGRVRSDLICPISEIAVALALNMDFLFLLGPDLLVPDIWKVSSHPK